MQSAESRDEEEAALDTIAAMLRVWASRPLPLEEDIPQPDGVSLEDWARHVLVRAPLKGDGRDAGAAQVRRDWGGLRMRVAQDRKWEAEQVRTMIADLRQAIFAALRCCARATTDDGETDEQLDHQMKRLRVAAEGSSLQTLKQEVVQAAESIGTALEKRRKSQTERIAELARELQAAGHELEQVRIEGMTDGLTKVYNRKAFDEQLMRLSDAACLFDHKASLLLIDVDHFKKVNDTKGHPCGDRVLQEMADCICRQVLRRGDFVARYGGEEFGVLLPGTTLAEGRIVAERIRKAIEGMQVEWKAGPVRVTASLGVALSIAGEAPDGWVARADQALYAAKAAGRNCISVDEQARVTMPRAAVIPVPKAPDTRRTDRGPFRPGEA